MSSYKCGLGLCERANLADKCKRKCSEGDVEAVELQWLHFGTEFLHEL